MDTKFYSSENTVQFLQTRINSGWFSSRYDQYADEVIRHSYLFYTNTLEQEGRDAAEAALVEWNSKSRCSDFASLIKPVAEGMLTMAQAYPDWVTMFDIEDHNWYVPHHEKMRCGNGKAIVLTNRSEPNCGCVDLDTCDFGLRGLLGVKAIVLAVDNDTPLYTQLGIVLPIRRRDYLEPERRESGFTMVTFHLDGHHDGSTYIPNDKDPEYMKKELGLIEGHKPKGRISTDLTFNEAVGFPGATHYLADQLPRLKEHFSSLAEKLPSVHMHCRSNF